MYWDNKKIFYIVYLYTMKNFKKICEEIDHDCVRIEKYNLDNNITFILRPKRGQTLIFKPNHSNKNRCVIKVLGINRETTETDEYIWYTIEPLIFENKYYNEIFLDVKHIHENTELTVVYISPLIKSVLG